MRTAFGRFSEKLRVERNMTQTEFSDASGMSLSRISNVEHQRSNIGEDVVRCYLRVLQCNGKQACELRKLANFSNGLRKRSGRESTHPPLQVMLEQFGDRISPKTVATIQNLLEKESGELVETLRFSSNQSPQTITSTRKKQRISRPSLLPSRLAEIAVIALDLRRTICKDNEKLDVGRALQILSVNNSHFDYKILKQLPIYLDGAFACIQGHKDGHTIIVEESRFQSALNGVHFFRHVICHEIGHHILHAEFLQSNNEMYFAPQELAKNSPHMIGSDRQIEQVIDSVIEVEAECFAMFFLIPWDSFIKGTTAEYLASDFGEQKGEVKTFANYFKNVAVLNAFREILWQRNERHHPIFGLKSISPL